MNDQKTIVLLVDDQKIIHEAVRQMLEREEDIELVCCLDPTEALKIAEKVQPTIVLQDLVMPQMDGLTLVRYFRAAPMTEQVPIVVLSTKEQSETKAQAFAVGANDYMVKLPEKPELLARIRYHSKSYIHLLQRNAAQQLIQEELDQASRYVVSLLPDPLQGEITTKWKFVPCTSLGGDSFGYHWINDQHFAMYLLDVCGHGTGAALLSISAMNVLRSQTLQVDFTDPAKVLESLNKTFPMEEQNNMFFTMWYGVYDRESSTLCYASGGHPPAVLHTGWGSSLVVEELKTQGLVIGGMPDAPFSSATCTVEKGSRLYLFSDGVFELLKPNGEMMELAEFVALLAEKAGKDDLEQLYQFAKKLSGNGPLADDFSIVRIDF